MKKQQRQLKKLIKAAKDYVEFQSIGNGAKLNCAIDDAEKCAQSLKGEGEWTKDKPTEKGLYFRSNPAFQKDITQQDVYLVSGELKTHHPLNEGSRLINIKDMPSRFLWIKVPYPPHYKKGKHQ